MVGLLWLASALLCWYHDWLFDVFVQPDDLMALVVVILYDLLDRKFQPREPMKRVEEGLIKEVRQVEDSLYRSVWAGLPCKNSFILYYVRLIFCESHVLNKKSQLPLIRSKKFNWRVFSEKKKKNVLTNFRKNLNVSASHPSNKLFHLKSKILMDAYFPLKVFLRIIATLCLKMVFLVISTFCPPIVTLYNVNSFFIFILWSRNRISID